jgi:glucose-1-phosphate cytidylyltransferase
MGEEMAPDWQVSQLTAVILAGGRGSRLQDDTNDLIPKPMVTIGDKPILEHIINIYVTQGVQRIVVASGHLGEQIEEWVNHLSIGGASIIVVPTGEATQTGGRIAAVCKTQQPWVPDWFGHGKPFFLTYGDGLSDINLAALLEHHARLRRTDTLATLTAVHPPARFGSITIEKGKARVFLEKSQADGWINGGFYVVESKAVSLIPAPSCRWEYDVLPILSHQSRLGAFQHPGWWMCMDTRRDREYLEEAWAKGDAPWTRWSQ